MKNALETIKDANSDRVWVLGEGLIMAILFFNPLDGQPDAIFASLVGVLCILIGVLVVHRCIVYILLGQPLTISDEALLEGLKVLGEAIGEVASQ